jgi:steroid delta-isomerase-like uncharacterized protein
VTPGETEGLVRRFYEQLWNRWDDSAVDEVLADDFEFRGSLGDVTRGRDQWRAYRDALRAAMPDFHNEIVELVVSDGRAAARLVYTGHLEGVLLGRRGHGESIRYEGAAFFRSEAGRLAEAWVLGDLDALRRQLAVDDTSEPEEHEVIAMRGLVNGFQVSQAISVAATLGVADQLAGGPRSSVEVAAVTGCDPRALHRLLRALAAVGVFVEDDAERFGLGALGEYLRADGQPSIAGWASYIGSEAYWSAWGNLLHSVRTGENAFVAVHGVDPWQYRANRPELSALFDRAMVSLTALVSQAVIAAYDFGGFDVVVDVGGGTGAFLADILVSNPAARGVLFDQSHVVAGAPDLLSAAGVDARCDVVGGSFFDSVPDGGDVYVMKSVIHDWDDERAEAVLRTCRRHLSPSAVLVLVERVLAPPNEGAPGKLSDLNMLVSPGGQERTLSEYTALLERCGFGSVREVPTRGVVSVIEARPA